MNVTVPSMAPGARSLPAELLVNESGHYPWNRGQQFAWQRLAAGQHINPGIPRMTGLRGLGDCEGGIDTDTGQSCATIPVFDGSSPTDTGITPTVNPYTPAESPYPVVTGDSPITVTTQNASGGVSTQTMTPAQYAALIASSASSLTKVLAVTQGGTVLANGTIIGSAQSGAIAAAASNPLAAGTNALLSSPLILLLIGGAVLLAMTSKK